jgi:nitrate reductase delta subunit
VTRCRPRPTYVELFDRGRATSLHLFEHVHGDSRERGPAMIDLGQTYEKAGLILAEGELPDYLPAVLEFVSTQPPDAAKAFLGEMAHILNALFGALQRRNSALRERAWRAARPGRRAGAGADRCPLPKSRWTRAGPSRWCSTGCSVRGQGQPGQTQAIHVVQPLQPPRPSRATSAQANPQSGVVA